MINKPIQQLPKWAKVLIRVTLLPAVFCLHLIPHIVGIILSLKNWVMYGGELINYQKNDTALISDIYQLLKTIQNEAI